MIKPSLQKHAFSDPPHQCFYCSKRPDALLLEPDGSEIRVCLSCGQAKFKKFMRKFKRFSKSRHLRLEKQESLILEQIPHSRNQQMGIAGVTNETN